MKSLNENIAPLMYRTRTRSIMTAYKKLCDRSRLYSSIHLTDQPSAPLMKPLPITTVAAIAPHINTPQGVAASMASAGTHIPLDWLFIRVYFEQYNMDMNKNICKNLQRY